LIAEDPGEQQQLRVFQHDQYVLFHSVEPLPIGKFGSVSSCLYEAVRRAAVT
jgi:hypothetical protein